ncbi:tRNA dimethylallyltransferase [Clostridium sp. CAG:632]|jgi:tRNA dimethylallyltransferase|nr:tRNA (adenosine(37)-N6)-dimethylallyltransferase MiaA [Clostridium sp.]CCY58737.1 tRNA dimethylallyltransferase [Clostridium sp. CAG:632]
MKQQYKTKKPLIILTGPTAVGKTKLSIELAKAVNGQMISADSMQVYRHMDIGTAKIRPEEMQDIPHYLIDVLDPWESFDVVRFQTMAKEALEKIYTAGAIPIVVGGTGFYIQALLYNIDFDENDSETGYRSELQSFADRHGVEALHDRLRQVDEKSADMIHPNNIKRVIRALEFYHQTGTRISEHNETQRQKESPYRFVYFVLDDERERIYRRIDQRIDQMLDQGLVAEVKQLRDMGCTRDMVSMQGLGYKEILAYLDGECTLEEAVYILKRDTRHFAKRQLTWFRREHEVRWIERQEYPDEAAMLQAMLAQLPPEFLQNNYSF